MSTLKARFIRCPKCKRLLTVDSDNPTGKCTQVCRERNK